MSGYDGPGEGWRELSTREYEQVTREGDDDKDTLVLQSKYGFRYWAPEEPAPPLPTEPYTVIEAKCADVLNEANGVWMKCPRVGYRPEAWERSGEFRDAVWILARITGFEVLSRPVTKVLAEDEDAYYDSDDIRQAEARGFSNGAKQVIDYFESKYRFAAVWTTSNVVADLRRIFLEDGS